MPRPESAAVNHQEIIQAFYQRQFTDLIDPVVRSLSPIHRGWENEVFSYDLEHGPQATRRVEKLILRIYPGRSANEKSASEFQGMQLLHRAGYPVPQVIHLCREDSPLGNPFVIMERFEGELLWSLMSSAAPHLMQEYITIFCRLFVQLHRLDWRAYVPNPDEAAPPDPFYFARREIQKFRTYENRYPVSGFLPVLDWLEDRIDLVPCHRAAVVHLDFHPENILVQTGPDGSVTRAAVIDWTNLDISDARFDIAWTSLLTRAYAGSQAQAAILQEYERQAGESIDHLQFFEVAACVRRLYGILVSIKSGAENAGMRPGAQEQMKGQMAAIGIIYEMLTGHSRIRVPEVEELIEQLT